VKIRFWGTRGSIARAHPSVMRYGGNTACMEILSDSGQRIIVDCGTGAFALGQAIAAEPGPISATLLISHTHWDHIQGLPFFSPLFAPGNSWDVCGPRGLNVSLRETLSGQMQYEYFPIKLEAMGAQIRYRELVEGAFAIGDVRVRTQFLDHPALTLGYRFEADGVVVVYSCDHECTARVAAPGQEELRGSELRHVDFLRGADLVIHDAQFTAEEYPARVGWGHSTPDYALAVCRAAGVRRLILTHHDPARTDDEVDAMVAALRAQAGPGAPEISAAAEGEEVELSAPEGATPLRPTGDFAAETAMTNALAGQSIALAGLRPEVERVIRDAAAAEDLPILDGVDPAREGALDADGAAPSLVVVDAGGDAALSDALIDGACAEAERADVGATVIAVSDAERAAAGRGGRAVEWMVWPFTQQYAQTRLRAAVLRKRARWVRAAPPEKEDQRLAALQSLKMLDTPPDERFDRLTRMAAAAFDIPVSLVSLVDSRRQWLKSRCGIEVDETPREIAFCAHTILEDDLLIVPDARIDPRFADNPAVAGPPGVRFYAGAPVRTEDGFAVGTFCLIDTRPRSLSARQISLLRDFARLTEREIALGARRGEAA